MTTAMQKAENYNIFNPNSKKNNPRFYSETRVYLQSEDILKMPSFNHIAINYSFTTKPSASLFAASSVTMRSFSLPEIL